MVLNTSSHIGEGYTDLLYSADTVSKGVPKSELYCMHACGPLAKQAILSCMQTVAASLTLHERLIDNCNKIAREMHRILSIHLADTALRY